MSANAVAIRAAKQQVDRFRQKPGQSRCTAAFSLPKAPTILTAKSAVAVLCQIAKKRLTLVWIADPGIGPVAGRTRAASRRLRRSGGSPIFQ